MCEEELTLDRKNAMLNRLETESKYMASRGAFSSSWIRVGNNSRREVGFDSGLHLSVDKMRKPGIILKILELR